MADPGKNTAKTVKCPQCKTIFAINDNPSKPFCSERCKMIDLGNWLTEKYKVGEEEDDEEEG